MLKMRCRASSSTMMNHSSDVRKEKRVRHIVCKQKVVVGFEICSLAIAQTSPSAANDCTIAAPIYSRDNSFSQKFRIWVGHASESDVNRWRASGKERKKIRGKILIARDLMLGISHHAELRPSVYRSGHQGGRPKTHLGNILPRYSERRCDNR